MAETRMAETKLTERIADAYRAATIKGAWYGPTVAELLTQIPPDAATKEPAPEANTISALLQHMLLWNDRVIVACEGKPLAKWEAEKEWAEPAIPWAELVERWNRSRDLLEERIRNFPIENLGKTVLARDYPYEHLLRGIVDHTIYHAGQISMVWGMLRRNK
jgi:uncharacterized damage-inducible protein DinB